MNINFTLIIQAINFLIAYILINKLLLKPVLKFINNEEYLQEFLHLDVEKAKEKLEKTQNIKLENWQEFQKHFSQSSPHVLRELLERLAEKPKKTLIIEEFDSLKITKMKKSLEEYLINKVENV